MHLNKTSSRGPSQGQITEINLGHAQTAAPDKGSSEDQAVYQYYHRPQDKVGTIFIPHTCLGNK